LSKLRPISAGCKHIYFKNKFKKLKNG